MTPAAIITPILTLRMSLAAVFAMSAAGKGVNLPRAAGQMEAYGLLPNSLVRLVAIALTCAEMITATLLLAGPAQVGALLGAVLMAIFSFAIAINLYRGRRIACGCDAGGAATPISGALLARSLVLAAFLVLLMLVGQAGAPTNMAWTIATGQGCVTLVLYAGSNQLLANRSAFLSLHLQRGNV
jgi:hypothetical protein